MAIVGIDLVSSVSRLTILAQILPNASSSVGGNLFLWLTIVLIPVIGLAAGLYYLISLPLRRQERARYFLDLLESGLKQGRSPEHTITAISETQERSVGIQFHLVAAYIRSGMGLFDALEKVPRLLPPQITAMLRASQEIGDPRKVLPVCRRLLTDAGSQTNSAFNYLLIMALVTPIVPVVLLGIANLIMPKYREVMEIYGIANESVSRWLAPQTAIVWGVIEGALGVLIWGGAICYLGGPRFRAWVHAGVPPLGDWLAALMPWRRKRLQRDFAAILALLLDAEVPEAKAVELAAAATANAQFIRRGSKVIAQLREGEPLPNALRRFDSAPQLHWRLLNASQSHGGFFAALSGWIEALDAKAFQQEQAASQLVTTAIVLVNGVIVGSVVVGLFYAINTILNQALLW